MTWCTAWRGTPQDCIDHMCRAHTVLASIKTANLTRWFPPWTVSREHWSNVLRSSVSGVATDTLLLSRIGVPLVHRYRVFARAGTHVAFCGTYMARLRTFLNVADTACLRSRNRRRTRSLASQMSPEVPVRGRGREPAHSSQPSTSRRPSPESTSVAAVAPESSTPAVVHLRRYGRRAASVPLDLALPCFAAPGLQTGHRQARWVREYDSPASLATLTSPSLCLNLDTLSSDGSAGPGDVSSHPICISDVSTHSGDRDQELSDDDTPPSVHVDLVSPTLPPAPARVQQFIQNFSPVTAPVTLTAESSAPISPNRVRSDCTPGTVDGGPVFQVSLDTTGFLLRVGDAAVPALPVGSPALSETASAVPLGWGNRWRLTLAGRFRGRMLRP